MDILVRMSKNRFLCIFCGKIYNGISCSDRLDSWIDKPNCRCEKTIELNKLMGSRQLDAKGIQEFIKSNSCFEYKNKKIINRCSDSGVNEISEIDQYGFHCLCNYNYEPGHNDSPILVDKEKKLYACPRCGIVKLITI